MGLDRKAFTNLFINANCVAEVALRREMASVAAALAQTPAAEPGADGPEPDIDAMFAGLDLGALDGLDLDDAGAIPVEDPGGEDPRAAQHAADDAPADATEDLDAYLRKAYVVPPGAAERIDRMRAGVDEAALEALLGRLPTGARPLTERLAAEQLDEWLAHYADGDPALSELVILMRG